MGTTLTTLHLYGIDRESITSFLAPGDVLRDVNPPWISVVPGNDKDREDPKRLDRTARNLTKSSENGYALLFFYFDEDAFGCKLFKAGKRVAGCESGLSWSKLGKCLDLMFGDNKASKAFRYKTRCYSLDEQVNLLEETLGVALKDFADEEPRCVLRSEKTLQAVKKRVAELRKRLNHCTLSEVPLDDWPDKFRTKQRLYEHLRPQYKWIDPFDLKYSMSTSRHNVPHSDHIAVYYLRYSNSPDTRYILYDAHTDCYCEKTLPGVVLDRVLWMTKQGGLVWLVAERLEVETSSTGNRYVACYDENQKEIWRFNPVTNNFGLSYVSTSSDGVITLCEESRIYGGERFDTFWYQIDGETGKMIRSKRIPIDDEAVTLIKYAKKLDAFVYNGVNRKSEDDRHNLVVLDNRFTEKLRCSLCWEPLTLSTEICDEYLIDVQHSSDSLTSLRRINLVNGNMEIIHSEMPMLTWNALPKGEWLGSTQKSNSIYVFDEQGILISRHSLKGTFWGVTVDEDKVLIWEYRFAKEIPCSEEENLDSLSIHLWELQHC